MKTDISLRSIAALLLIAVPSMSIISCTDDEDLASFETPEPMVTAPAEEWDILGPTEFEKVGPDASTASQMANINEKYDINLRNVSCSTNGRRKVAGTITATAVGSMIAKTALDQVKNYAKNYAKKKVTGFVKDLFGIKDKPDPTMEKLNEIRSQLDGIDNKLTDMTTMLQGVDDKADNIYDFLLKTKYDDYNTCRINLAGHNNTYINKIAFEIERDSVEAEKNIPVILEEWAKTTVNGNPAYLESVTYAKNMCEFKFTYSAGSGMGSSMNFCTLYDKIAYDSFPWENLGYESREQFRALQSMHTIQGLELSYLYYSTKANGSNLDSEKAYYESQMNMVQNAIENVTKFFELNEIEYHNDKAICQIKGSHFEINLKDGIKSHPGITWKNGTPFSIDDKSALFMSGERSGNLTDAELKEAKSHCLTPDDVNRMKAYFDNYLSKKSSAKEDWFTLAGFDMSKFPNNSGIITSESYSVFHIYTPNVLLYYTGKPSSWWGDLGKYQITIDAFNLLTIGAIFDGRMSGDSSTFAANISFENVVSKGKEYQYNWYVASGKIPAWHSFKVNLDSIPFSNDIISLTLNRLD